MSRKDISQMMDTAKLYGPDGPLGSVVSQMIDTAKLYSPEGPLGSYAIVIAKVSELADDLSNEWLLSDGEFVAQANVPLDS